MPRLPTVGGDAGNWGGILNDFLRIGHRVDGGLKGAAEVFNVKDFGAKGDGVADDTIAIQAIFNSGGSAIYYPPGIYLQDTITVPTTVKLVFGTGEIKQRATNTTLFTITASQGCVFNGLKMTGNYAPGQTSYSSLNEGIVATSCSNCRVINCDISRVQSIAIHLINCTDSIVNGNMIKECGQGIYLRGSQRVIISDNHIDTTILAHSVFTIAISCESTDGHVYGINRNVIISGNVIKGYKNAQGIEAHAASDLTISHNTITDPALPISINPFNSTDTCSYISINGNICRPETIIAGYADGNDGIICQAGSPTPDITDVVISSNVVINANRATSSPANQGGIRIGFTNKVSIVGNVITAAKENGIVLTDSEESVIVSGNIIDGIIAHGTAQNGILIRANSAGIVEGNSFKDITTGYGIKLEVPSSIQFGKNVFRNVTTPISNPQYRESIDILLSLPEAITTAGITIGPDTNLYRSSSNTLKTDDKLIAKEGLGVGNSADASSPGRIIKKIEIFDAQGKSLGFLPVYDTMI